MDDNNKKKNMFIYKRLVVNAKKLTYTFCVLKYYNYIYLLHI